MHKIRIGTRKSPLAWKQAEEVKARLINIYNYKEDQIDLCPFVSKGDKNLDQSILKIGGKSVFTKEIENALLENQVDLAVHSLKDLEVDSPAGLKISAILPRENPFDAFISTKYKSLLELPQGATLGTSSIRRQAQTLSIRPDLKICLFRGNVQTRYQKLKDGIADGTFLAIAGLNRLNLDHYITQRMTLAEMIPAPGQGAIAVQIRQHDQKFQDISSGLNCKQTQLAVTLERLFLNTLDGSCHTPVAAHAFFIDENQISFKGQLLKPDGTDSYFVEELGSFEKLWDKVKNEALKIKTNLPKDFFNCQ